MFALTAIVPFSGFVKYAGPAGQTHLAVKWTNIETLTAILNLLLAAVTLALAYVTYKLMNLNPAITGVQFQVSIRHLAELPPRT